MRGDIFEFLGKALLVSVLLAGARCLADDAAPTETADSVLAKAASAYTSANAIEVRAFTRVVMTAVRPGQEEMMSHMGSRSFLIFRMRKPDDWYAAGWFRRQTLKQRQATAFGAPAAETVVSYDGRYVLAKVGGEARRLPGFREGGQPGQGQEVTGAVFKQVLRDELIGRSTWLAFAPLLDAAGSAPFELNTPRLIGVESWSGHDAWRVEGQNSTGQVVDMWINQKTALVVRTVVANRMPAAVVAMPRMVTETIYRNRLGESLPDDEFMLQPPSENVLRNSVYMSDDEVGFGPASDLAQYGVEQPEPAAQAQSSPFGSPTPPPGMAAVSVAPAASLGQALSPEQMAGIVLINGDEGTATGFMTKMRGIDFVVTNEHVIGGNKRITVQDLSGNTLPVLAIYGAVGRDVAILRIARGAGTLTTDKNVFKNVKIGDSVVVVGNKLGGGVATQASGRVLGIGPTRIEIDANFEPGNSGSPIFDLATHDVVGVAAYQETRKINVSAERDGSARGGGKQGGTQAAATEVDKRWFGFRIDGITQWQAIDMDRWHAQSERIAKFRALNEALVDFIHLKFNDASENEQLAPYIIKFQAAAGQLGNNRVGVANVVKDMLRNVGSVASAGVDDFAADDYYDYYQTCLYWEDSVPMQIEYRKRIIEVLTKYENHSLDYVSRLGNGGGQ